MIEVTAREASVESPFCLPTSDEWDYACGAGSRARGMVPWAERDGKTSRTLFRWGDDCPSDHYPTEPSPWELHTRPNAFGLRIAADPYQIEAVLEPEILYRGGDGGGAICGGSGFLTGWLPLATAYRDPSADYWRGRSIPGLRARRVFPLPV